MSRHLDALFTGLAAVALAAPALADTIASGESKLDTLTGTTVRSYDFDGTAGDRVVITSSQRTGSVQPEIRLFYNDPTLGLVLEDSRTGFFTEQKLDRALSSTGTYTIRVQEASGARTGFFSLALVKMPGASTSTSDADGGAIASASTRTGSFNYAADTDVYTFTGTADDRIVVTVSDTSFSCQPEIYLYPPGGGPAEAARVGSTLQKKLDWRLAASGTYTIVLHDALLNQEGTYTVSFVKIPGSATASTDPDGGTIASGATLSGTITPRADLDVFTFAGTVNDRVIVTTADYTNATQTEIYLYPPGGGDVEAVSIGGFLSHRLETRLQQTGTYTILLHDNGLDGEGSYAIAFAKVPGSATSTADTDGGSLTSGGSAVGTLTPRADTDIFTFEGTVGDRVVLTTSDYNSFSTQTEIYLYPPGGGELEASSEGGTPDHRLETRLLRTGTYTVVVQDSGQNGEGSYAISLAKIPGPTTSAGDSDGGALTSGRFRTGAFTPRADTDLYTFEGQAGDRVILTTADFGPGTQAEIYLYPPDGGALEASDTGAFSGHRLERVLAQTGTYTVLVQDSGLNGEGSYAISFVILPGDEAATPDEDGGTLVPGQVHAGRLAFRADVDVWQFFGEAGERVVLSAAELAGNVQPEIYLYDGTTDELVDLSVGGSSDHRIDVSLPSSGIYTVLVSDYRNDQDDGYYGIALARLGGAATAPDDTDGGPIELDRQRTGRIDGQADTDCWQFYGAAGDQVTIRVERSATNGGSVEPEIHLYPPGGGAAETTFEGANATKVLSWQLRATGLYTVLVADARLDADGFYTIQVGKNPPTAAPGIHGHFPPNGATVASLTETMRWAPVAGATGYDVRLGTDLLAALPTVATGLGSPAFRFPEGTAVDETHYWQVVARTGAGDIPGPVLWFRTSAAPVVASDDFSDGDENGDVNWFVVSGLWSVDTGKRYVGTGIKDRVVYDNRVVFPSIPGVVAGEVTARVGLTSRSFKGPNAEFMFAFEDPFRYRFVRFTPGKVEIGQTGSFAGNDDSSVTKVRAKLAKGTFDAKAVLLSDGTVQVFLKRTKDAAFRDTPDATYRFQTPVPGFLGLRAKWATTTFDDFGATVRTSAR